MQSDECKVFYGTSTYKRYNAYLSVELLYISKVYQHMIRTLLKRTSRQSVSTTLKPDLCFVDSTRHFFPEGVVGLVPKRGCLLTLAYYVFPR
jgi:hypothetical protein